MLQTLHSKLGSILKDHDFIHKKHKNKKAEFKKRIGLCYAAKIGWNPLAICFVVTTLALQSHGQSMQRLIENLKQSGMLKSKEVATAMSAVDRKYYCPENVDPYQDSPQNIGYQATISAPHMHAYALETLKDHLKAGGRQTVLDIGSGSGYLTVCMAVMMGDGALAIGVEHIPELASKATAAIQMHQSWLSINNRVKFVVADGRQGYAKNAPYDAIHAGAAFPEIPYNVLDQLKPGGRFVGPIGSGFEQFFTIIDKGMNGDFNINKVLPVSYVKMQDKDDQMGHLYHYAGR